jgi:predicted ATPase/class 3 adenylate cyclase
MKIAGYTITDTLFRTDRVTIHVAVRDRDGADVAIKTLAGAHPTRAQIDELRREFQLTLRLAGIPRVIRIDELVTFDGGNVGIVMEYFGVPLRRLIRDHGRPSLGRTLDLAIGLAQTLGAIHEMGIVHKDVTPNNILVSPDLDDIRLIDFGIASELASEQPSNAMVAELAGSFAYMSPEQSGRMNRRLDYRSDFYSLGVTLFEVLTGTLPFDADHALGWIQCHVAQPAPAASERDRSVPTPVSAIVQKLMAKNAEDRYQSAFGLIADLERCRDQLDQTGVIAGFDIGRQDLSRTFDIPQRLFGRDAPRSELLGVFDLVASGSTELLLVAGESGVGKTALVSELAGQLVRRDGHMVSGKFDQLRRNTAYAAMIDALHEFVQQLLTEPDEALATWRRRLLEALGTNGQLIVDVVPDIERIIGPQAPVAELPPTEALNRFRLVFANLLRAAAQREHPLVIFLDDLQWSDGPTLELLELLVTRDIQHLLVIGAYRDNEVDSGGLLSLALNEIRTVRDIHVLHLEPLTVGSVAELVAATLHCSHVLAAPLAELLYETAQGNPFFTNELLRSLHADGLVRFDAERGAWTWDVTEVRRAGITTSVAEFVAAGLRRLPESSQRTLEYAACIGNSFDLHTLAVITESDLDDVADDLMVALQSGFVLPLDEDYRIVGHVATLGAPRTGPVGDAPNPRYAFRHDRVHLAAYELIPHDERTAVHLSVGRLMRSHTRTGGDLMETVGHLNRAVALIDDPDERMALAEMNLSAARRATESSAYSAALELLVVARTLLPADSWDSVYELTNAVARQYQLCAYLTGLQDVADEQIDLLLAHARTDLERAEILSVRTRQYATIGRMEASIESAIEGLALLGVAFPPEPDQSDIDAEFALVRTNLGSRTIEELIDAPRLDDPIQVAAVRLLMEIFPAAFLSGSGSLFPFLVLRSVNISLAHGNSSEAAFAYAAYGMLLCGAGNDPALGFRYGQLAVAMNEQFDDVALKSRVIYLYAMFIHHWNQPWATMTPWFRRGIEAGYQSGDLLYLAYSAQDCIIWDPTLDLAAASALHRQYLAIVRDSGYQDSLDSGTLFLQMQLCFMGATMGPTSLTDDTFDEETCLQGMLDRRFMTGVANYHIYKTEIAFLHGDHAEAMAHIRIQDTLMASAMSLPQLVRYKIVAFLTLADETELDLDSRQARADRFATDLAEMTAWAGNCPANFLHLQLLMEAELLRLDGECDVAVARYDDAAASARANGYLRDEATIHERTARCLLGVGRERAAEGYVRAARRLFDRWGAQRKVDLLSAEYTVLLDEPLAAPDRSSSGSSQQLTGAALDLESVIKASQAIAGDLALDNLWERTLPMLLENAGARRACFLVRRGGVVTVETEHAAPDATVTSPGDDIEAIVPMSIVNHVLRTGEVVLINSPETAGRFSRDTYLTSRAPQSLICIPMTRTGRLEGAIYMENELARNVFTDDRAEVIRLLAAQALVSFDNAELFAEQVRITRAQQRFVPRQFLESLERADIGDVELGDAVAKEMSVLFADLRGFTTLAERLDPAEVIALLNDYFGRLEPTISAAGGYIDSFAGDEIMALFEGPADDAVRAGIAMSRALGDFNDQQRRTGRPELRMGIGVNTGPLLLGTVGGVERIQCTVIGDTVNGASRIEQLTKTYGAQFLIGEGTYQRLADSSAYSLRRVDSVTVKGKTQPFDIYQVLDAESADRRAAKQRTLAQFGQALDALRHGDAVAAARLIDGAMSIDPDDEALIAYAQRCAALLASPATRPGAEV